MDRKVVPGYAKGNVIAPPSKSMAHRLLICAGLCKETSIVKGIDFSDDILATLDCLKALGAEISCDNQEGTARIRGINPCHVTRNTPLVLPCRESGSTMRFMLPITLLSHGKTIMKGKGRLPQRPMAIYEMICREQGLLFEQKETGVEVCGPLRPSNFAIPGDSSSQFLSGLLFALPLLDENSTVTLTTTLESRPYVDMTLQALALAGISVEQMDVNMFHIPGGQHYRPITETVEGDYSNAAFWEALNVLDGQIEISGLSKYSKQGDRVYQTYFSALQEGTPHLSVTDCPDLAPILMTLAAACHGVILEGTRRLKLKESDRGHVMAQELQKFGANIMVEDDRIIVEKSPLHAPTEILYGHNDHRIVMSLAVLATRYGGIIRGTEAVSKSYPAFWDRLQELGIEVAVL